MDYLETHRSLHRQCPPPVRAGWRGVRCPGLFIDGGLHPGTRPLVSALRSAFRRWDLLAYLLILAGAATAYVYRHRGIPGVELLPGILPAVGLYLLSHAVRSIRL